MKRDELFNHFVSEINCIQSSPCENPVDLSVYDDSKTKRVLKDIDNNHNYSWIKEIWERNKKHLNYTAIVYRGKKFSYKDFFIESYRYALALKNSGLKKGQEFMCVIENTPEFPFIMGATSIIGAKVNLVSAEFDKEYLEEMLNRIDYPYVFVSDMSFTKFSQTISSNERFIPVIISLNHSLEGKNPFEQITNQFYKLNEQEFFKSLIDVPRTIGLDDFLSIFHDNSKNIMETSTLDDDFTITYTSGSTGWGRPKGLVHRVRSYITMGRYHDTDITGIPSMKQKTTMALIKTMSDTDFMTNVSDTLMQSGIVALEPINDKDYFLTSLVINKPTYAIASRSYWIYAMKQQLSDKRYKNVKLPFLLVPTAVGEPLAANEEKTLNKWLRSLKTGVNVTKTPFSIVTMCTGGGDSEHGGIFISIFRSLQSKLPSHNGIKEPIGMTTYGMVRVKALREDGTYCAPMETGKLVANSPCNMEGYVNNDKSNEDFFIKDAYGNTWGTLNTYGYIDKTNHIYVKGRVSSSDTDIPNFTIADVILKDTKNIMSCEVVNFIYDNKNVYVAHIEPQLGKKINEEKILRSAVQRCINTFGEEIINSLFFRIRTNEEGFDLLHTGKRNNISLINEGLSENTVKASEFLPKNSKTLIRRNIK